MLALLMTTVVAFSVTTSFAQVVVVDNEGVEEEEKVEEAPSRSPSPAPGTLRVCKDSW